MVLSKVYGVYPEEGGEEEGSWNRRICIAGGESVWDKSKRIVALRIIKYLNRSSDVTLDDIPLKYRNNPNVEPFILSHSLKSRAKKDAMLRNYRDCLLKALCNGDRQESVDVYGRYSTSCLTLSTFTTVY